MANLSSRGLHSAILSFIGAMGFLASAVLPAEAYLVSIYRCYFRQSTKANMKHVASLWLFNRRIQWGIRLYPPTSRLALFKYPFYSGSRASHRVEYLIWSTRSNCRSMDL